MFGAQETCLQMTTMATSRCAKCFIWWSLGTLPKVNILSCLRPAFGEVASTGMRTAQVMNQTGRSIMHMRRMKRMKKYASGPFMLKTCMSGARTMAMNHDKKPRGSSGGRLLYNRQRGSVWCEYNYALGGRI
jgi:hypothetical protein